MNVPDQDWIMLRPILVIEDSDEDFEVLKVALNFAGVRNELIRCATAVDVSKFLRASPSMSSTECPVIILLDLNIPGGDGRNILRELRADPIFKAVPVIILTTSAQPQDVEACYRAGASGYIVKPVDLDRFESQIQKMTSYWLNCVQLPKFPAVHA
jgi:CheY-like chemotaxis protein